MARSRQSFTSELTPATRAFLRGDKPPADPPDREVFDLVAMVLLPEFPGQRRNHITRPQKLWAMFGPRIRAGWSGPGEPYGALIARRGTRRNYHPHQGAWLAAFRIARTRLDPPRSDD
jgi:hypothetical protein